MVFWRSNNEEVKRVTDFYPKGMKKDFCTIPNFVDLKEGGTKVDLGYCGVTRWSFGAEKKGDKVTIALNCEPAHRCLAPLSNWSVNADVQVCFVNDKDEKSLTVSAFEVPFNRKDGGHNWTHTFEKCQVKNGFLNSGSALFEIHIGIVKLEELYSGDFVDFSKHREGDSDVVLVVNNKKFHISKQILSIHSPVFQAMFHGNFNESAMSEIPISDVDLNAFHIFLQYIYMAPIYICASIDSWSKKINEMDVEELAIWWSTNPALPGTAMEVLKKKLNVAEIPFEEFKKEAVQDPTPLGKESSSSESTSTHSTLSSSSSDSDESDSDGSDA
uniref:BTB domain-containing protein n=1 Tax=Caenorhabditis tropicalis TaxID=1561998 RepID=A0A1I7V3Z4_9PELO